MIAHYRDLVIDTLNAGHFLQRRLQHLFQVERANRPAHNEHVFSAYKLESGCPSMEVRMRIEDVIRAPLNSPFNFHGDPGPFLGRSSHGFVPLRLLKGSAQADTDQVPCAGLRVIEAKAAPHGPWMKTHSMQ